MDTRVGADRKLTRPVFVGVNHLMFRSETPYLIEGATVKASKGYFGRKRLASEGPDKQHRYISILLSLKKCVQPPKPDERMK